MKRLTSVLLALIIGLYNIHVSAEATFPNDTSQYRMDDYYENIHHYYRYFMDVPGGWDVLSHDEIYVYNKWVDTLKNNKLFNAELDAVHFLTDVSFSGIFFESYDDDVKVQYYVSALSGLLMTMEDNLSDIRASQAKVTSSMTWRDYVVEAGLSVAGYMSQYANGVNWKVAFETCGVSLDILNSTVDTLERYESLQLNVETYLSYYNFLEIMQNNDFDPLLAKAAEYLIKSLNQCFNYRMVHFSEFADIAIEAQSSQFFNVLDKIIDEVEQATFASEEWAALYVLSKTASAAGSFKLGVDMGKLTGDILIGSSDHIQRYYEMRAMSSARSAMIQEIKMQDSNINGVSDAEKIPTTCNSMMNLLYINLRGAYCAYRIQTQDVGVLGKIVVKINGKEDIEEWFDGIQRICNNLKQRLETIMPDVDGYKLKDENAGDFDLTEEELKNIISTYGIIGAWHYADYDGNGSNEAFAVIIADDNENGRLIKSVYYVDSTGKSEIMSTNLNLCLYKRDDGCYRECSGKDFFWFDMGNYGSGWCSAVYSVKDKVPYELDISRDIQGFYQDRNGAFYTSKNELLPEGGHIYFNYELIFNEVTQQFSIGNKINISNQTSESYDNESSNVGFIENQTAEQLRKNIIGSWGSVGSITSEYEFEENGTCYWESQKQEPGSYEILNDKTLVITLPWTENRYTWSNETFEEFRLHSNGCFWYFTNDGVLMLNGECYYKNGKITANYNVEGDLLAILEGTWIDDVKLTEYIFFMDGSYEENSVYVVSGGSILVFRDNLTHGKIDIIDDTTAKLWQDIPEGFGYIPSYTELIFDLEGDKIYIGGSANSFSRAQYED